MRLTSALPSKRSRIPTNVKVNSKSSAFPAPVEGWDAISPIATMPIKRAQKMENWFPQPSWVELRKGCVKHAYTRADHPVETLMAYQGAGTDDALFAASNGQIFNATGSGNLLPDVTGLTNSRFQHINFATSGGNFLYAVNGADLPQYYDGSTWAEPTITGEDASDFVHINAFKNRLFFIFNASTQFAYLPLDSIQGAASSFELGGLMTMGGYLMAMGTWSIDAGDGPDDYAVFYTSRGQAIIYRGLDPGDADSWSLVGVFNMGAPLGRRCMTKAGADIALICIDGVVPLSRAMIFERAAVTKVSLTQNIQRVMNDSARLYGDNFGWQLISYPRGTRIILNVPIEENSQQQQYVMNSLNGAWCLFTGQDFSCFELLNDVLYGGGNDGFIYECDTSGTDASETIVADMMTAFSNYGNGQNKRWVECQPLITTDGQVDAGIAVNVDFKSDAPVSVPSSIASSDAKWDEAVWDDAVWPPGLGVQTFWRSVTGLGTWASIRMVVRISPDEGDSTAIWGVGLWGVGTWADPPSPEVVLQVNGFNIAYEAGSAII